MPTLLDKQSNVILTADWQSRKIFQYEYEGSFNVLKDLKTADRSGR
jgi:hypothetical protein